MSSVGAELLNEIERVAAKRERWRMRIGGGCFGPPLGLEPGIRAMTLTIDRAKRAIVEDDAVAALLAYEHLKAFDSDD